MQSNRFDRWLAVFLSAAIALLFLYAQILLR